MAVSGGSDSTALLLLALDWAGKAGATVQAVTLDHRLRPEAADETASVAALCAGFGVPHTILRWETPAETNLMAAARAARYRLIAGWAAGQGIGEVLVGHTGDDVAETFLMRLGREAGLDGLAAMRAAWVEPPGVTFRRPLLAASRATLRRLLADRGVGWIDDPSNEDLARDRPRTRRALRALTPLGLGAGRLARVAGHLAQVRDGFDALLADWAERHARMDRGDLLLDIPALATLPDEAARRLLAAGLRLVSGAAYPPRAAPLARLVASRGGRHSLHGCLVRAGASGLRMAREPAAAARVPKAEPQAVWDSRWLLLSDLTAPDEVSPPHPSPSGAEGGAPNLRGSPVGGARYGEPVVRALGEAGLRQCPGWRATGLPRASLLASPAVWSGERLLAAPLAGRGEGWTAELAEGRNSLSQFLIAH